MWKGIVLQERAWRQGRILAFLDSAVMSGIWVEAKLLVHVLRARAATSTGAEMDFLQQIIFFFLEFGWLNCFVLFPT